MSWIGNIYDIVKSDASREYDREEAIEEAKKILKIQYGRHSSEYGDLVRHIQNEISEGVEPREALALLAQRVIDDKHSSIKEFTGAN